MPILLTIKLLFASIPCGIPRISPMNDWSGEVLRLSGANFMSS